MFFSTTNGFIQSYSTLHYATIVKTRPLEQDEQDSVLDAIARLTSDHAILMSFNNSISPPFYSTQLLRYLSPILR